MSNSESDLSDNGEKKSKKICCKDCGKKFAFHQGLYTHRKSGVCKKTKLTMFNSVKYLENMDINIEELMLCDNINSVYKYLFKHNDYNKLPFIISDKKRKLIRFYVDEDNYVNDKDYTHLVSFLNKIRYMIIREIKKDKLYNDDPDSVSQELTFLNVMLRDFDIKIIIGYILSATTDD